MFCIHTSLLLYYVEEGSKSLRNFDTCYKATLHHIVEDNHLVKNSHEILKCHVVSGK